MFNNLKETIYRINYLTEDIDSMYHQASLKLGVSDSVMFVLYMAHTNNGKCLLQDIYKLSGISKQTINSAIRRLEGDKIIFLEKHSGKTKLVCLTESGKEYAKKTAGRLFDAECCAFADWTSEEIELYVNLIKKHTASLRNEINKM